MTGISIRDGTLAKLEALCQYQELIGPPARLAQNREIIDNLPPFEFPTGSEPGPGELFVTALLHKPARLPLVLGVLVSCVGCDQVTKKMAVEKLQHAEGMSFLGDVVRIQYAENPGAFLGLFSNLPDPARFYLVTVPNALLLIALAAGVLMASRNVNKETLFAMTLVLGGGLGNLIDRVVRNGRVTDFLNVGIGPLRTGIFNLADVCIMLGALLFFYVSMRPERMPAV